MVCNVARRTHTALYFADDKDIYDLLLSSKRQLTSSRLSQLLRCRGLIWAEDEDRESLIRQIALVPHGWNILGALLEATDKGDRAEKLSSSTLRLKISQEDLAQAALQLKNRRSNNRDEVIDVTSEGEVVRISLIYSEVDTGQTRLCQKVRRELAIDCELDGDVLRLRHQAQPRAEELIDDLAKVLAGSSEPPERQVVELGGVRAPERRTQFFLDLLNHVPDFQLDDVRAVRVHRLADDEDEPEDSDLADQESEDVGPSELRILVKRAALEGQGLLGTPEYERLREDGFFVSRVAWTAHEKKEKGRVKVAFEAEFGAPEQGRDFRYRVAKVFDRTKSGTDFKKTGRSPTAQEMRDFGRSVEKAAQIAMTALEESSNNTAPLLEADDESLSPLDDK